MDTEILFGAIHHLILAILLIITLMDMVFMYGRMGGNIKASGSKIKCMEMEVLLGAMERSMKEGM